MAPAGRALACLFSSPSPRPSTPMPQAIFVVSRMNWRRAAAFAGSGAVMAMGRVRGGRPGRMSPCARGGSGLNDLAGALLEVGLFRDRAGGVQRQLVHQAVLVEEGH